MRLPRNLCAGVRALLKKRGCDAELDEELRGFLESVQLKKMQSGLSGNEALREARMEMGSIESVKEGVRSAGWETMVETLWQDLRYGLRMLRKSPGFTAVAVLTLALGIGANTAIFSVVNAVLLKSLPFRDAGQLVAISEAHPNIAEIGAPTADLRDWRAQSRSFEDLAAYSHHGFWNATMMVHGEPEEVHGSIVTHNLFPLLGIVPAIGRNFLGEEDALGRGAVAILSGEIWKTRFGGDPKIIGQPLVLDGKNFTVVGVLPAGIRFPGDVDVWVPLANMAKDDLTSRYYHALFVVGRLRPGVTVSEAGIEMAGIGERLSRAYPNTNRNIGVKVEALQDEYVAGLRSALIVLWCAVGLVLLIACANVASLLLARAASREGE
ncbi:MAG: ABC transporter permease, partial [Candidatus Acidiferrales bacterium]